MKKSISFLLVLCILCSFSSIAFAEHKTLIRSVGLADCEWELTVPSIMAPGDVGEVTLEGTWDSLTTVKVSTPEYVTITNDLDGETENLEIAFFDISKKGDNRKPISLTRKFSVAQQQQMLFGTWEGYFNYYVTVESSNPLFDSSLVTNHSGIIPEGGTYTSNGTVYNAGEAFPELTYRDIYVYGDYKYTYTGIQNVGYAGEAYDISGWAVTVLDKSKTSYGTILSSINGLDVVELGDTFKNCTNLVTAPEIPETIVGMGNAFEGCTNLVTMSTIPESVRITHSMFSDCPSLTGEIEINCSELWSNEFEFWNTEKPILLYGSSPYLEELASSDLHYNDNEEVVEIGNVNVR
jgi:hypothetical protein